MARIRGEHAAVGVEGSVEQQPIDALVVMEVSDVPQVRRRGADMRVQGRRAVRGDLHAVLASGRGLCSLRVQLPLVTSGNRLLWLRHYVPAARGGCTGGCTPPGRAVGLLLPAQAGLKHGAEPAIALYPAGRAAVPRAARSVSLRASRTAVNAMKAGAAWTA